MRFKADLPHLTELVQLLQARLLALQGRRTGSPP
jgi:hypothetical protein